MATCCAASGLAPILRTSYNNMWWLALLALKENCIGRHAAAEIPYLNFATAMRALLHLVGQVVAKNLNTRSVSTTSHVNFPQNAFPRRRKKSNMYDNSITTLPDGIFQNLTAITRL